MNAAHSYLPPAKDAQGRIFLLRHGAVRFSDREKHSIGQQDLPLSEKGLRQARAWADHFAHSPPNALYCSDLERCRETARLIGRRCALDPQPRRELWEVALGTWEGETFAIRSRSKLCKAPGAKPTPGKPQRHGVLQSRGPQAAQNPIVPEVSAANIPRHRQAPIRSSFPRQADPEGASGKDIPWPHRDVVQVKGRSK